MIYFFHRNGLTSDNITDKRFEMQTAYISHPACLLHEMGTNHPECPARIAAIEKYLNDSGLMAKLQSHDAPKADKIHLLRAHPEAFVANILTKAPTEGLLHIDGDTSMNPYTIEAALRSAGAGILATDLVLLGNVKNAFCNVRPPGHHAEIDRAMGFCFFNNIAVAALHAIKKYGIERIAIVDFDVHHGNGTEDILAKHQQVLFCSTYQHPFYPGYAGKSIQSKVVNVPLPAGTGGVEFRSAVESQWLPELREFKPELIFISAGFDAHAEDSMGGFHLVDEDYIWVTKAISKIASEYSKGRIISMLEGGYDLASLARSATEHIRVLMEA